MESHKYGNGFGQHFDYKNKETNGFDSNQTSTFIMAMYANAQLYDQANFLQRRDAFKLFDQIRLDMEKMGKDMKNFTVLDMGCGTGNLTIQFTKSFQPKRMVAFDLSDDMIDYASKFSKVGTDCDIKYYQADASEQFDELSGKLKLEANSVDLVISIYCLHWITDRKGVMDNIQHFLKPGGRFYLIFSTWTELFPKQHKIIDNNRWRPILLAHLHQGIPRVREQIREKDLLNGKLKLHEL